MTDRTSKGEDGPILVWLKEHKLSNTPLKGGLISMGFDNVDEIAQCSVEDLDNIATELKLKISTKCKFKKAVTSLNKGVVSRMVYISPAEAQALNDLKECEKKLKKKPQKQKKMKNY
eukprot:UN18506